VLGTTVVADVGSFGHTKVLKAFMDSKGKMTDSGANCSMTNNKHLLDNITQLEQPINIGVALTEKDDEYSYALCTHAGQLPIVCDDGSIIRTFCFYNPHATDTIISPQAIVDASTEFDTWTQIGRKLGQPGELSFGGKQRTSKITLHQQNGLYYCNSIKYNIYHLEQIQEDIILNVEDIQREQAECEHTACDQFPTMAPDPMEYDGIPSNPTIHRTRQPPRTRKYTPTSKAKILESETWYLRMGGCNETQLKALGSNATGVPPNLEFHPFRYIDFKEQARIRKQPVGNNPLKVCARAKRFYIDFGFLRASTDDFTKPNAKKDRIIQSFDGYSSYVLVVDEFTKYSWIFLTSSKKSTY
jgi:hypothetical protein